MLKPEQFDDKYFGVDPEYSHKAGYTNYSRIRDSIRKIPYLDYIPKGSSCLVLGCAFGFEVERMRELGILACGIDVYPNAIEQAKIHAAGIESFITVGNIFSLASSIQENSFDYIFSKQFLECLSDKYLEMLVPHLNRIAKVGQVHITKEIGNESFYKFRSIEQLSKMGFEDTIIMK